MIMQKVNVKNGIDRIDKILPEISGARIGLITNQTGVNKYLRSTIDILHEKRLLYCLFSPEHGVRGSVQAGVGVECDTDSKTGLPVYSLYGKTTHIQKELLESLDIIAFDIQDVGARFYTYTSTLSYAMEDCAAANKKMLVFDRINPVGGNIEGTVLDRKFSSFVGRYPIASRHGLTVGEFANYINRTEGIGCDLTVVPTEGWSRNMLFDESDLVWIPPSPNIPTAETAFYYIGTCLAEATNLSEGRGTAKPFEFIGAPWLKNELVADAMNEMKLNGVIFRACDFVPSFSKYKNESCKGIQLHITDKHEFRPFESALRLFDFIRHTHCEFGFLPEDGNHIAFADLLFGSNAWRDPLFDADAFLKSQDRKLNEYKMNIKEYYLY